MEKKIKPYGKVYSEGREYYLLQPRPILKQDGTFECVVVPYFDPNIEIIIGQTPRFIRMTSFLAEHSKHKEITIQISELEE